MNLPINYRNASSKQRRSAREEYVRIQNGLCCFCKFPLTQETPNSVKEKYPLELESSEDALVAYRYTGNENEGIVDMKKGKEKVGYECVNFPKGMLDYPVHLHHDHKTGMTIGAIHSYCNIISFVYFESDLP